MIKKIGILVLLFFVFFSFVCFSDTCVRVSRAHLRKKPYSQSKVSWVVGLYTPLIVRKKHKFWSKVEDVDGQTHWILNSQLTHKWRCGTILKKAFTRKGAGVHMLVSPLGIVDRYWSFKILKRQDHWLYLKDKSGQKVWVFKDLIWRALSSTQFHF